MVTQPQGIPILRLIIFIPLQILWLPVSLIGIALVSYKLIWVSMRKHTSLTAVKVLNNRWIMDLFGLRADPAADRLVSVLANDSRTGLWMVIFPFWAAYRLTGRPPYFPRRPPAGKERVADVIIARSFVFDEFIAAHLNDAVQLVILGAGLDTRAYGPLKDTPLKLFELDKADVQRTKLQALRNAGIAHDHVHYIPVDFTDPDWMRALKKSPFDPDAKTIFLWEGVSIYLSHADVRKTLAAIKAHAAPGSVIIADFYAARFLTVLKSGLGEKILKLTDERFMSALDFSGDYEDVMDSFITAQGLETGRCRFLGTASDKGPFMVVAEIMC